jgi:predicted porin
MNKNIKLAVAGAVLALSATANAGIIIPAGDWTVDIGGNVNAFVANVDTETTTAAGVKTKATDSNTIGTGLLPSALGIGAKTRQNDIDTAIQFTFFTGSSSGNTGTVGGRNGAGGGGNSLNIRQAFLTFGDKSWGTFKLGRDLGIFGSDAILSDMTLLGVGTGGQLHGGSSTLGRIGSGYIYADWKGQVSYASPNFNGFQVSAGVMENFGSANQARKDMSYEAKATYDFAASDVTGRIWVSGLSQKSEGLAAVDATGLYLGGVSNVAPTTSSLGVAAVAAGNSYTSRGVDIGAKLTAGPATLVGYYYDGKGLDGQNALQGIFNANGVKSDDDGGYVQATFVLPTQTKLGASWGRSNSKHTASTFDIENESWVVGAYHPLTKHLNLVAEYTDQEVKNKAATTTATAKTERDTVSLGAILFF